MKGISKIFTPEVSHLPILIKELFHQSDEGATMKVVEYLLQSLPLLKAFLNELILKCVERNRK